MADGKAQWIQELTGWSRQTGARDITLSVSFHEFSGSADPVVLLEKPFSLSCYCRKSLGKQVFLVLALLNIPHTAYTRIYNSFTKQIAGPVKSSLWNSRGMNFCSLTTSVSFNFLSFLAPFATFLKQHCTALQTKGSLSSLCYLKTTCNRRVSVESSGTAQREY